MSSNPVIAAKTVTTAGTQVQLSTVDLMATAVVFEGKRGNTGYIYIGDLNVSNALYMASIGSAERFSMAFGSDYGPRVMGDEINLKNIWVDSSVNGEIVMWSYFTR